MITKSKVKVPEYCNSKEFNELIQQLIRTELAHLGIINLPFNHITKPVYTKKTVSTFIPVTSPSGRKIQSLRKSFISDTKRLPESTSTDDPVSMEIDIVRDNESKSLATVNGQINDISFPIVCDSGSNISGMPIECCNELGMEIDTSKIHNLSGYATNKKTVGMVHNVSISLAPECTIVEDFVVTEDHPNRELILSRTCLRRYNYDLLESRDHVALTCNDKNFFIPIVSDINRTVV